MAQVRRLLEPGPIVLVSSQHKGQRNIMTMGWHTVMEFTPSLIGCVIASSNYSFGLIRKSRECVINIPTVDMADKVVGIGNCSGQKTDKFAEFELTALPAHEVGAPLIKECFANLECRIHDTKLINSYNFFIFEVLKAHVARLPQIADTLHYHGQGMFTSTGTALDKSNQFTKWKKTATF